MSIYYIYRKMKKLTLQDCQDFALTKNGKCLSTEYLGCEQKLSWQCDKEHIWQANFDNIKNKGRWCPYCVGKAKYTLKDCQNLASSRNGKCLSSYYENIEQLILWECEKRHNWRANFNNIRRGTWCPTCAIVISKPQREVYKLIAELLPNKEVILNDTQTIKPFDLDIYIPSLKIGIEYDGEYWHYSDWAIENGSFVKMKRKDDFCANKEIRLLRIRENDWQKNKSDILNTINEALNG